MSNILITGANRGIGLEHARQALAAGEAVIACCRVTRGLAVELADRGVKVISLAPGWTQTALGGPDAEWPVEKSVSHQRTVIARVGPQDSGHFINLTGETLPW